MIDRVRLYNGSSYYNVGVCHFNVDVSNTTTDESAFTHVLNNATAQRTDAWQEFVFPDGAVAARYVRFFAIDNYGGSYLSINELEVKTVETIKKSYSSYQDMTYRPDWILDSIASSGWMSSANQVTNQSFIIRLGEDTKLVDRIRLLLNGADDSVKDYEVWISTTTDSDSAFTRIMTGTTIKDAQWHDYVFPDGAVRARYVKFVALNNYNYSYDIRITELQVMTAPSEGNIISLPFTPKNVAALESPSFISNGGSIVSASSGTEMNRMLDLGIDGGWMTSGTTNQWVIIQLGGNREYTVEGVRLATPVSNYTVKDFQIYVSADNQNYSPAYSGIYNNTGTMQDYWFSPQSGVRFIK